MATLTNKFSHISTTVRIYLQPATVHTYQQVVAALQNALLNGLNLVIAQVQNSQVDEAVKLAGGKYRIKRVSKQIISESQLL